jgi:DDE superfamily endonuclease
MDQATPLWTWWLSLLSPFAASFTRPGGGRFVQWGTGMVLCGEEPTVTQLLTALGLESRWRVLEHVAECGAWDREAVERHALRLIEQDRPARWGESHPVAIDDPKRPRTRKQGWGTCTCHEASARSPTRAGTVRAHHWGAMGDWGPGRPWTSWPHAARLYGRQRQWPAGETFRPKTALAVAWLRQAAAESPAPILAVCDGA